jgi:hypothetical protein
LNLSASWSGAQSVESLMHMEALLGRLQSVLDEELNAVGRFDFEAMALIDRDKRELVGEIEVVVDAGIKNVAPASVSSNPDKGERELQARVAIAAEQVRAMIHANSALLGEAISAISAKLGLDSRVESYDKRARTVGPARRPSSKSI